MVDLFSGLGGASAAMRERGWLVFSVDVNRRFRPDLLANLAAPGARTETVEAVEAWAGGPGRVDLVWASPPCNEFAREWLPWSRRGIRPSLALVEATHELVARIRPTWWALENVRGAVPYLGPARQRFGSFYLWGDFPLVLCAPLYKGVHMGVWNHRAGKRYTAKTSSSETGRFHRSPALRAKVPYQLSAAIADAVEGAARVSS